MHLLGDVSNLNVNMGSSAVTGYPYTIIRMKSKEIIIDSEIMSGTPVFRGTRVPVQWLFDWLETETLDEFLDNFPTVSRQQATQVLRMAEKLVTSEQFINEAPARWKPAR